MLNYNTEYVFSQREFFIILCRLKPTGYMHTYNPRVSVSPRIKSALFFPPQHICISRLYFSRHSVFVLSCFISLNSASLHYPALFLPTQLPYIILLYFCSHSVFVLSCFISANSASLHYPALFLSTRPLCIILLYFCQLSLFALSCFISLNSAPLYYPALFFQPQHLRIGQKKRPDAFCIIADNRL